MIEVVSSKGRFLHKVKGSGAKCVITPCGWYAASTTAPSHGKYVTRQRCYSIAAVRGYAVDHDLSLCRKCFSHQDANRVDEEKSRLQYRKASGDRVQRRTARETPCDTKEIHSAHIYGSCRPFKWCPGVYGPHIDHEPRQIAKTLPLLQFYQLGPKHLQRTLGLSDEEVKRIRVKYLENFVRIGVER